MDVSPQLPGDPPGPGRREIGLDMGRLRGSLGWGAGQPPTEDRGLGMNAPPRWFVSP
jgi:hypothetical protein